MAKRDKKDVYYFPHDYNPTSDPKMLAFIGEFGAVGYGVYWRIVEMLHESAEHTLPLKNYIYSAIAKQMLVDSSQVSKIIESCIDEFELFESNEEYFWCNRVLRNVEKRIDLIAKKKKAGDASAEARRVLKEQQDSTDVKHVLTDVEQTLTGVQHISTEGNKLNEIKLNETIQDKTIINNSNNNTSEISKKTTPIKFNNDTNITDEDLKDVSKNINLSKLDYDTKKRRLEYFKDYFMQASETEKKDFCSGHKMLLERLERAINDYNLHLLTEKNSLPFNYVFYKEWFSSWLKGLSTTEFDIYMTRIRRN